jgi:F-type H+-transporting ATPase subunit epsilon
VVARGFVEVLPDRVTILAEEAEKPEEVDTGAVQQQLQHGEKLWNEAGEDPEKYERANEVIREAEVKLESTGAGKHDSSH